MAKFDYKKEYTPPLIDKNILRNECETLLKKFFALFTTILCIWHHQYLLELLTILNGNCIRTRFIPYFNFNILSSSL